MSGQSNWLSRLYGGAGGGPPKISRKKLWWLAGAVLLGIGLIVLGNSGGSPPATPPTAPGAAGTVDTTPVETAKKSIMAAEEEAMAAKLQSMLEKIEGAGSVRVTVRLAASARESYAINTTTGRKTTVEKDQGGGTRTINENTDTSQLVIARSGKGDSPVVEMETASRVAGVLVVSSGAGSPRVRESIFEAVRVALNVEPHKILVLTGQGGTRP